MVPGLKLEDRVVREDKIIMDAGILTTGGEEAVSRISQLATTSPGESALRRSR